MGVPVFFKWLSMRNPKIIRDATQLPETSFESGNPPIDNFYIDMNGLIHPSCNPKGENIKEPKNFEEQCANLYQYVDKLINIVRPKKTLFLAIDGVAPRAKMNQQRSRRFRAALEGEQSAQRKLQLLQKYKNVGAWTSEVQDYATKKSFDSNMITPGTKFLTEICKQLRSYIQERLSNHRLWKNLLVVFSDSNCPGEGEHKIMDFIRQQRGSQGYSPNQSHCIYGADADLIMLGLAAHEPRFYIIRQIVITANDKWCTSCQKRGHYFMDCRTADSIQDQQRVTQQINKGAINVNFQFIRLQMVREYIHYNYMHATVPFGYDLERIIDDFIFLCFFVGNDFLPHVPCLSIRQGGIDVLMKVYEICLKIMPDYLTNEGNLNMKSLKIFIGEMSQYEESLIEEMINKETSNKQRQQNQKADEERQKKKQGQKKGKKEEVDEIDYLDPLGSFKADLDKIAKAQVNNLENYSVFKHSLYNYKQKYYKQKFRIKSSEFLDLKYNLSKSYIEALKWICGYYYRNVPSWSWFYPFHYSPFFTDITVPDHDLPQFDKQKPFKPFQQLMAVLPPKICDSLPKILQKLMLEIDSPISDYYPSNFYIDLVGKKFAWLGEVLLPFIDDRRLLRAMGNYEQNLNDEEMYRNRFGTTNLYINKYGNLGRRINKMKKNESVLAEYSSGFQIEGKLIVIENAEETIQFRFNQPQNRRHQVKLKEGIYYNPLEEITEEFISKTDRAAFGGQRYLRVIERILGRRKERRNPMQRHNGQREEKQRRYEDRRYDDRKGRSYEKEDDRRNRSRSREKRGHGYNRGKGYDTMNWQNRQRN